MHIIEKVESKPRFFHMCLRIIYVFYILHIFPQIYKYPQFINDVQRFTNQCERWLFYRTVFYFFRPIYFLMADKPEDG